MANRRMVWRVEEKVSEREREKNKRTYGNASRDFTLPPLLFTTSTGSANYRRLLSSLLIRLLSRLTTIPALVSQTSPCLHCSNGSKEQIESFLQLVVTTFVCVSFPTYSFRESSCVHIYSKLNVSLITSARRGMIFFLPFFSCMRISRSCYKKVICRKWVGANKANKVFFSSSCNFFSRVFVLSSNCYFIEEYSRK